MEDENAVEQASDAKATLEALKREVSLRTNKMNLLTLNLFSDYIESTNSLTEDQKSSMFQEIDAALQLCDECKDRMKRIAALGNGNETEMLATVHSLENNFLKLKSLFEKL